MKKELDIIAFDADDTLWENETKFRASEELFAEVMRPYTSSGQAINLLYEKEVANLNVFGYGVKGFILSMIESALELSGKQVTADEIERIIAIGRGQLARPVEVLSGVEGVLSELSRHYKLILVTKGDLLEQQHKLAASGLASYFDHIEIISEKKPADYRKLMYELGIEPSRFMMVGNSLKSDILPVLELGAWAIYIPFKITWKHEQVDVMPSHPQFAHKKSITEVSHFIRTYFDGEELK